MFDAERLVQQEAEADGVGEVDDGLGVEVGVDDASLLAGVEQRAQPGPTVIELLLEEPFQLGVSAGGDERLEEDRLQR